MSSIDIPKVLIDYSLGIGSIGRNLPLCPSLEATAGVETRRGRPAGLKKRWEGELEYSAGKSAELMEGDRRVVACGEEEVGIFKIAGEIHAWLNRCAHLGGPVCQGRMVSRVLEPLDEAKCVRGQAYDDSEPHIVCPWHGYEYSIKTGAHPGNPKIRLRRVEVVEREGELYVSL